MNCTVKNYIKVDYRSHRRNRFSSRAKSKDRDAWEGDSSMLLFSVKFSPTIRLQEFGHAEEITDLCSNKYYKLIVNTT